MSNENAPTEKNLQKDSSVTSGQDLESKGVKVPKNLGEDKPPSFDSKTRKRSTNENDDLFDIRKRALHKIFVVTAWLLFGAFVCILVVVVFHLLLPPDCLWLDAAQLANLNSIMLSAITAFGGILFGRFYDDIIKRN